MADRSNRPPRVAPKTTEEKLSAVERDISSLKASLPQCATRAEIVSVRKLVDDLRLSIDTISEKVDAVTNRKGFWTHFWVERNWSIAVTLILLGGAFSAMLFGLGVIIDRHSAPLEIKLNSLQQDIARLNDRVHISDAGRVVRQIEKEPSTVVKQYVAEIQQAKQSLARATDTQLPEYWPTVFGVLRLASIAAAPIMEINLQQANHIEDSAGITFTGGGTYILKGHVANSRFNNAVIVFDPDVVLKDVLFVNCVFVFPKINNPPRQMKDIGKNLLQASNIENVKVTTA